ncbi:hypothetical protein [Burkholderia cenocepacia]|uniref:hypothetical protein n=1 Tax=Burkholderia cenocepacia TaxID=95486 RepID=UPI0007616E79|nr:hypothetical protein [Burkholderia cenocepacia]KWU26409.1 hypothetical protein AS149_25820 [Burkholderia cenocepacia]
MRYTVVGIYTHNNQRYATDAYGFSATDAVVDAFGRVRDDNQDESMRIQVCAVFRGHHASRDVTVSDSRKRPEPRRCRAKKMHRYTVATEFDVQHVTDRSPIEAELSLHCRVAGVFAGHLKSLKEQVDWRVVERALTTASAEATASLGVKRGLFAGATPSL